MLAIFRGRAGFEGKLGEYLGFEQVIVFQLFVKGGLGFVRKNRRFDKIKRRFFGINRRFISKNLRLFLEKTPSFFKKMPFCEHETYGFLSRKAICLAKSPTLLSEQPKNLLEAPI